MTLTGLHEYHRDTNFSIPTDISLANPSLSICFSQEDTTAVAVDAVVEDAAVDAEVDAVGTLPTQNGPRKSLFWTWASI